MSDAHLCQRYATTMKKSNGIGAEGVHNRDVANVHNAIHGARRKLEWELILEAVAFCYGPSVLYGRAVWNGTIFSGSVRPVPGLEVKLVELGGFDE